jgi:hypothetical protein
MRKGTNFLRLGYIGYGTATFCTSKKQAADFSEMLITTYWITWYYDTQDRNLNIHCHENHKFFKVLLCISAFVVRMSSFSLQCDTDTLYELYTKLKDVF